MMRVCRMLVIGLAVALPSVGFGAPGPMIPPAMPAAGPTASGNLAIRAIPGTRDAAIPAGAKVLVTLFHQGRPVRQLDATLDDTGLAVLSDVPVVAALTPVVQVEYSGVTYQDTGPEMTPEHPDSSVQVTVFETTNAKPAWRVVSRQVLVTPSPGRVSVSETVYVDNPSDKTWLGDKPASNGKTTTVDLSLPERAENVTLGGGFHGWCCTTFEGGTLAVQMPLMPGKYVYQFTYDVATPTGEGTISLGADAVTDEVAMFIPESGVTASPDGLSPGSVQMTESGPLRLYVGRGVGPGQRVSVALTGLVPEVVTPVADPGAVPAGAMSSGLSPVVWIGGGVVLVLGGYAVAAAMRRGA
ncbi:MAG: hypothetical protein H6810_01035 [Phycisphaeraceae bacterium]|nr:MAG: hypothetical protein H6810_01035 [Phycisphaeraceae bacterium]